MNSIALRIVRTLTAFPVAVLHLLYDMLDLWKNKEEREVDHAKVRNFIAFLYVLYELHDLIQAEIASGRDIATWVLIALALVLAYSLGERVFLAIISARQSIASWEAFQRRAPLPEDETHGTANNSPTQGTVGS